jgi:hypothetical protein
MGLALSIVSSCTEVLWAPRSPTERTRSTHNRTPGGHKNVAPHRARFATLRSRIGESAAGWGPESAADRTWIAARIGGP